MKKMNEFLTRNPAETLDDYLWRLGNMKECGITDATWDDLCELLISSARPGEQVYNEESGWRKRFVKIRESVENSNSFDDIDNSNSSSNMNTGDTDGDEKLASLNKILIRARDERSAMRRALRNESRKEDLMEQIKDAIVRYEPFEIKRITVDTKSRAVYAMLSDIHYGISFDNRIGKYNPEIARERVMAYADRIIALGYEQDAGDCYVSLMGDLISGNIHTMIRVENRENVVEQVIGVSELISQFLYELADNFDNVYVNTVSGNHSRIDLFEENTPRAERLDALIPWYCAAKLENIDNVVFMDNDVDPTVCNYQIFGKNYYAVHGDFDKNMSTTAERLARLTGQHVDYLLSGHMHVASATLEETGYIRNGSVCGSGDEYTVRKRLFAPPYQVALVVDETGVRSINPVRLEE